MGDYQHGHALAPPDRASRPAPPASAPGPARWSARRKQSISGSMHSARAMATRCGLAAGELIRDTASALSPEAHPLASSSRAARRRPAARGTPLARAWARRSQVAAARARCGKQVVAIGTPCPCCMRDAAAELALRIGIREPGRLRSRHRVQAPSSTNGRPLSTVSSRFRHRRSVLSPEPHGPISATTSPFSTLSDDAPEHARPRQSPCGFPVRSSA